MPVFNWENESVASQIAHDREQGQVLENKAMFEVERDAMLYQASQYNPDSTPLSEIVLKMVSEGNARSLWFKNQVHRDMDICDALDNACIRLGLSSEGYAPYLNDRGEQVEICL